MYKITVSDIIIDVIRKDIKNMRLAVYPQDGRVRISAPLKVKDNEIRLFAISKLNWIKKHKQKFENQERITEREYNNWESHYFQGRRYLLRIKETKGAGKVDFKKNYLDLYVRPNSSLQYKRCVINEWYRNELKKIIPGMASYWEKKLNVRVAFWGVKQMKTKWGSCNIQKKRIWLNLELAKQTLQCLEYVLVHEMVHLLERYHNNKFKSYMDYYLPSWKQRKDELNRIPINH